MLKPVAKKFWERANLIASDWAKLQRASDTISDVRSRCTAQLEVEYESTTKSYRIVDLTSLRQVYLTVQNVMPIITESLSFR